MRPIACCRLHISPVALIISTVLAIVIVKVVLSVTKLFFKVFQRTPKTTDEQRTEFSLQMRLTNLSPFEVGGLQRIGMKRQYAAGVCI